MMMKLRPQSSPGDESSGRSAWNRLRAAAIEAGEGAFEGASLDPSATEDSAPGRHHRGADLPGRSPRAPVAHRPLAVTRSMPPADS